MSLGLEVMRRKVEAMSKFHQIEVLRILDADKTIVLNENPNGVFVNLTLVSEATISKLWSYIQYVEAQQSSLAQQETAKESLTNLYFKHNKEQPVTNVKIPRTKK